MKITAFDALELFRNASVHIYASRTLQEPVLGPLRILKELLEGRNDPDDAGHRILPTDDELRQFINDKLQGNPDEKLAAEALQTVLQPTSEQNQVRGRR